MTTREAYIFGWVFGRLQQDDDSGDTTLAAMRPYSANAKAISNAHRAGILKGDLDREIGAALCQIDDVEAPMVGGTEKVQPLENQSSWQLGYYAGRAGKPLTGDFDIAAARRRNGLTQAQLAELVGVDQALVSRWESRRVKPSPESMQKLREVLL